MKLAPLFILLLTIQHCFSQSLDDLDKRFVYNQDCFYGEGHIELPEKIDIAKKKIPAWEKEKIQLYINYFLEEKPNELKQAIFRQSTHFSHHNQPILASIGIASSAFEGNFFNLSFLIAAKYSLQMQELIDERYDFEKSYEASKKYLNDLSENFSKQEILLAFINTPSGLKRAQKRAKSTVFKNYYSFLPDETKNVYFLQMALIEILAESKIQNKDLFYHHSNTLLVDKSLVIKKQFDLKLLEQVSKINKAVFKKHNPTLITDFVPVDFNFKYKNENIPTFIDSVYFYQDFVINNPNVLTEKDTSKTVLKEVYYSVKKGDNLTMISDWYDVYLKKIQIWNKLSSVDIYKGQALKIWVDEDLAFDLSKINFLSLDAKNDLLNYTSFQEELKNYKYYTVKKGDSLWLISQRYKGVSAEDIMQWNGISENIEVGQKILIKIVE